MEPKLLVFSRTGSFNIAEALFALDTAYISPTFYKHLIKLMMRFDRTANEML